MNSAMLYVPADRHLARLGPNGIPVHVGGAALTGVVAAAALAALAGIAVVLSARRPRGYAAGYVDGAAGRAVEVPEPEKSHLRSVT